MKKVYDFEVDPVNDDLVIRDGDFAVTESTQQHERDLIELDPGTFTQSPQVCVGIQKFLNDDSSISELKAKIIEQLEADGLSIELLTITEHGQMQLQAGYE